LPPLAVTTFPPWAWDVYARTCLSRMAKFWPGSVRAYVEGHAPPAINGIEYRPLSCAERDAFLALPRPEERRGFLWDAKRFCHKVFAQLDAAKDGEPFWWIDADVLMLRKPPLELLEQEDVVTFMGRDSYTETGLVGFNPKHSDWEWFEKRYRGMYTNGFAVYLLGITGWTDCHAFDAARVGKGKNLTPNGRGFDNVMTESPFGPYMAHFKGPLKRVLQVKGEELEQV
jgi:hypothetical protein